jgi:hypothetical protein
MKARICPTPAKWIIVLATVLTGANTALAAALDDIRIDVSHDGCEGFGDKSYIVYATNLNPSQTIDANFKYDSVPAQQHFILFDAALKPITDRFPKFRLRRLAPHEMAKIGCTFTYRASPRPPGPLPVPIVIDKQNASYVESGAPEAPVDDARSFAAFYLQGGINDCGPGTKPPGLFYLLNLHPYARLSASLNLLDDRGTRVNALTPNLPPLGAIRVGCSNGASKPGPIVSADLELTAGVPMPQSALPPSVLPAHPSPQVPEHRDTTGDAPALAPLALGTVLRTQNVCAGPVPSGWIKINDAWNPTVCGSPATITYNVWTIEQFADQPVGAVIHACKGAVPSGWAGVGTFWNPTVCGHPASNQPNVMAIKRLN